jgi:hypothetical protein
MRDRIERAERQAGELVAIATRRGEDQRLAVFDRDDGRRQADLDRRERLVTHLV